MTAAHILMSVMLLQVGLGISTLLLYVPTPLAVGLNFNHRLLTKVAH
jgi:heme A synthase